MVQKFMISILSHYNYNITIGHCDVHWRMHVHISRDSASTLFLRDGASASVYMKAHSTELQMNMNIHCVRLVSVFHIWVFQVFLFF
jgi:hypothetical protein